MKKVLLLLANGFEIYEASVFIDVIGWNLSDGTKNTKLVICGVDDFVTSAFGVQVKSDICLKDVDVNDYDALAIPGGFESYNFYDQAYSKEFSDIIVKFNSSGKMIASICVAALMIAKSGVLAGRKATTFKLMGDERVDQLKAMDVDVLDQNVVIDNNVVTSCSPVTAIDVAFTLLEHLTDRENCRYIKTIMGFESR